MLCQKFIRRSISSLSSNAVSKKRLLPFAFNQTSKSRCDDFTSSGTMAHVVCCTFFLSNIVVIFIMIILYINNDCTVVV